VLHQELRREAEEGSLRTTVVPKPNIFETSAEDDGQVLIDGIEDKPIPLLPYYMQYCNGGADCGFHQVAAPRIANNTNAGEAILVILLAKKRSQSSRALVQRTRKRLDRGSHASISVIS
jgi:hypothetical protein